MRNLTEAESELINNSEYTVDYSDLADEVDEEEKGRSKTETTTRKKKTENKKQI